MNSFKSPGPERFSLVVSTEGERVVLLPRGEIDIASCPELRHEIDRLEDGVATLVLDLRDVTFIDSSGVKLILEQIARERPAFGIVRGQASVQRMFEVIGIADRLPYVPA